MFEVLNTYVKKNDSGVVLPEDLIFSLDPSNETIGSSNIIDLSFNKIEIVNNNVVVSGDGPFPNIKSMAFNPYIPTFILIPSTKLINPIGDVEFTIEYWYKPINIGTYDTHVTQYIDGQTINNGFALQNNGYDFPDMLYGYSTGSYIRANTHTLKNNDKKWSHIAVTRKNNISKLFINGILVSESSVLEVRDRLSINWSIGSYSDGSFPNFGIHGNIAKLAIYDRCKYTESFTPV